MKYIIFTAMLFFAPLSQAAQISECQTDECQSYFKKFYKYAKSGYADAMYALGDMYQYGYGTNKNLDKAITWYKKSARYGSNDGSLKLAMIYLTNDEHNDYDDAIKYLKKAARNGSSQASYTLATIFYSKSFGEYDLDEVDKWLSMSFRSRGNKRARAFIEKLYLEGKVNDNDLPEVYEILKDMNLDLEAEKINVSSIKDSNRSKINWPKDSKIEVIKVSAPSLEEALDYELIRFTRIQPERHRVNTGSKIKSKTCEKNMSCSVMDKAMYSSLGAEITDAAILSLIGGSNM